MTELRPLELPETGVTVQIKRIPTLLLDDFWRSLPLPPKPPMQKVTYGSEEREEANPRHPDYLKALNEYDYDLGVRMLEFAVEFGVECEIDGAAVAAVRGWAEKAGAELPKDDKVVYVTRVLCQPRDLWRIRNAVFGRLEPREEEIRRKADSFRRPVQGKKHLRVAAPEVGSDVPPEPGVETGGPVGGVPVA